jgi:gamma-glutamyltranspeptidase/glutathione hydrolase
MPVRYLSRSPVMTKGGVVCSTSPLAASAGTRVLTQGGNAFDAAIAVAAVEAVTIPNMCGLGGEVFAILYEAKTGRTLGLTSSGAAPNGATSNFYRSQGFTSMPFDGPLAVSPPGEISAYQLINKCFGTWSLSQLLGPAIQHAEEGFPLPPLVGQAFAASAHRLKIYPSTAKVFLKNGQPYQIGDILVQKDLANTLQRISVDGAEEFYGGKIANDIVLAFKAAGGLIDHASMAEQNAETYEPLSIDYRGYTILENRPPSQGMLLLEMLNILEGYDLAHLGYLSPEVIHLMIEAKKLSFADRNAYLADPRVEKIPLSELLSKEHASKRRKMIDPKQASSKVLEADLVPHGSDTSYFCVADKDGNTVSFIHSLYHSFGSAFVAEGTGILFNNRHRGFRLMERHPNSIAPGKRPMHTLNAFTVMKNGRPFLVGGTPGADFQVQGNAQIITGVLDFRIELQQLVEAPRWRSTPGSDPDSLEEPYDLQMEPHMPREISLELEALGHNVTSYQEGITHGIVQLIHIDSEKGVKTGASDPRGDGHAAVA